MIPKLPIVSITPFTLLDFPGLVASIIWFTGCNFRCPYCHNPDMAKGRGERLTSDEVTTFLRNRIGLADGVVLSGGECTLNPGIVDLARFIKLLEYQLKLDTNGSRPDVLENLLDEGLLDYVALDFKAPLQKYGKVVGWEDIGSWQRSLNLLLKSGIQFEVRTTVLPGLVSEPDVSVMAAELRDRGYSGYYYLQHFVEGETLKPIPKLSRKFDARKVESAGGIEVVLRNADQFENRGIRGVA